MLRVLLWLASGALLFTVIALVAIDVWLRGKYEPTLDAMRQDLTAHVDRFCEEQATLATDPWFHEPRTPGDAGPLLNRWTGWDPSPAMPADSPLQLPAALLEKKSLEEWLASDVDLSGLDFGWMRELQRHDRWDLLRNTPVPPADPYNLMTASVPNFLPLQQWSKLRLVHGLRTGQPLEAARDVRHLAWLSYRTDTVLGAMIATALLGLEGTAHSLMKEPPREWRPQSAEQNARMRAVLWASMSFSSVVAPVEVGRKARTCGSAISRCIGLVEAGNMARYVRPLAATSYREAYAALDEAVAAASCSNTLLPTVWSRGVTIDDRPPSGGPMPEQPEWMRKLPRRYIGRHIAGILLAIAHQNIDLLKQLPDTPATAGTVP
ncbi:hypothetical protein [Pyxidicoccus xibeiensis]|uniref:hypothetical protein n=1 Tax=Pyxidicoccus xibeiensis TaxID=2906759 RepID=UPI0020A71FD7|nr:hypothetical protein [Pyxidicoccus xibeiensis]